MAAVGKGLGAFMGDLMICLESIGPTLMPREQVTPTEHKTGVHLAYGYLNVDTRRGHIVIQVRDQASGSLGSKPHEKFLLQRLAKIWATRNILLCYVDFFACQKKRCTLQ